MLISDLSSEQLLMLIIPALPNMWALKHAMYHDFPTTREKYRWMMACVFVPCIAGVAYYFVGRKHASKEKVDIRARMEAARVEAAGDKAESEAGGTPSVSGDAVESSPVSDRSLPADALSAPDASACIPEEKEPSAGSASVHTQGERGEICGRSARTGDDWSFGCPDDVRKPQA